MPGYEDHLHGGGEGFYPFEDVDAVKVGEEQVGDDNVERAGRQLLECLMAGADTADLVAHALQQKAEGFPTGRLVIDKEDFDKLFHGDSTDST